MTVELKTLRVSAEMDASKYTSGAAQKTAADKAMTQSGRDVTVSVTQTETKISQAGDVLARLSRQYVDGYAAAQRFNSAINQLSNGVERGKVSMQQAEVILGGIAQKYGLMADSSQFATRGQTEFAAAMERTNAKLREQQFWHQEWLREFNKQPVQRTLAASNQNTVGAFGAFNAGQQIQDIAVTAAMGQSIPTIALQQGLQLGTALEIQLINARAAGLSMAGALRGAFLGLLSPINLLAIGLTAVAAAAIQYFTGSSEKAKTMNDYLQEQADILKSLGPAYAEAARQRDRLLTPESSGVGSRLLAVNLADARRKQQEDVAAALAEVTSGRGTFMRGISALPSGLQSILGVNETGIALDQIMDKAKSGEMSILDARAAMVELRGTDLDPVIDTFLRLTTEVARSAQEVDKLRMKQDRLKQGPNYDNASVFGRMHPDEMGQLGPSAAERNVERLRREAQLEADLQQIRARTVEERIASARAVEAARDIPGELESERVERLNTAATLERARAERELADARRERQFAREDLISDSQSQLGLIGKMTGGEQAALRKEYELMQELREESRRTGVPVNEAEASAVRETAKAYGELTEAIARKQLATDLAFEKSVAGLNAEDAAIASRLHSAGLPVDLNSAEANTMRQINQINRIKDTWQSVFDTVNDGIDQMFNSLFDGGKDFEDVLKDIGRQLARMIFDLAITNPLKNWLTGSNLNSIADLGIFKSGASSGRGGGFGGVLGQLFGIGGSGSGGASVGAVNDNSPSAPANIIGPQSAAKMALNPQNFAPGSAFGGPQALTKVFETAGATRMGIPLSQISIGNLTAKIDARYAERFQGLLTDLQKQGYPISSLGEGGYSFRNVAGTNNLSNHAYGQALDINPSRNPYRHGATGDFAQYGIDPSETARKHGLEWGGNWRKPDTMHFQVPKGGRVPLGAGDNNILGGAGDDDLRSVGDRLFEQDRIDMRVGLAHEDATVELNKNLGLTSDELARLTDTSQMATESLEKAGLAGFDTVKGLTDAAGGLTKFGGLLSSFMGQGGGSGTGWFQGLMGMFGGAGGAVNYMMGISPGATGAILAGGALGPAGLYHEGGIAGFPSSSRFVSPGMFNGARRYHMGGLAGDEVPAILRRGEPVFKSMEHARSMFAGNQNMDAMAAAVAKRISISPKIINLFDPSVVGDYTRTDDGEKAIVNLQRRTGSGRGL